MIEEEDEELIIEEDQPPPKTGLTFRNFTLAPHDIGRIELCPASACFVGPKTDMHPGMWHGIFIHRFLQYVIERGREEALKYIKSKRQRYVLDLCTRMDLKSLPLDGIPEMNIAINTETLVGEAMERDVAEAGRHVVGRADIVFYNDGWNLGDFKTGKPVTIDPRESVQLLTLGTGLSLMNDCEDVKLSLINVLKTGELAWNTKLLPAKKVRAHAKKVRRVHLLALEIRDEYKQEGIEPEFHPGPHCYGCRAEKSCHVSALAK